MQVRMARCNLGRIAAQDALHNDRQRRNLAKPCQKLESQRLVIQLGHIRCTVTGLLRVCSLALDIVLHCEQLLVCFLGTKRSK